MENLPQVIRWSTSVNDANIEKVKESELENLRVGNKAIAGNHNIFYG